MDIKEMKNKMIQGAQKRSEELQQIAENIKQFAQSIEEDPINLLEGATEVLAGLKQIISSGQPLNKVGVSPASVAGIVAGLRVLSKAAPQLPPEKQQRALKLMGSLKLGDKMSLGAATNISNLANRDPAADKLRAAFEQYAQSGRPNPDLLKLIGQLQGEVDQAMRTLQSGQQQPAQQQKQQSGVKPKQQPMSSGQIAQTPHQGPEAAPPPAVTSGGISSVGTKGT